MGSCHEPDVMTKPPFSGRTPEGQATAGEWRDIEIAEYLESLPPREG